MQQSGSTCHVCERAFAVKFRYQVREEAGKFIYICSQACQERLLSNSNEGCECSQCHKSFFLEFPYQVRVGDGVRQYFCTAGCRETALKVSATIERDKAPTRRIAVFNHKGGTGKTTTAVNLAAGMADKGLRVLLIDVDGQGNVGASLGIRGQKTLYHVLVHGASPEDATIPVRKNLDVLTSNELLAAAELYLASCPNRDRVMRERLGNVGNGYDVVVLDCAPALSLMNQNALVYADGVIVPVSCDYLSLVGVKQVLKTMRNIRTHLQHDVQLLGVLPTFYDVRNRISHESLTALHKHFGDRCFTPIRVNTTLREAPSAKKTIFEYSPNCHGADDYRKLVEDLLAKELDVANAAVAQKVGSHMQKAV